MTDPADLPFDRILRRIRRDRAARMAIDRPLLDHLAEDILERLELVTRPFHDVLVLGGGAAVLAQSLAALGMAVTIADAGALYARGGTQCDEDRLPFPAASFDLIVSVGVLDTVNDLPGALIQLRRALRPDGLFLGAIVGGGSLPSLRRAMRAADEASDRPASPRLHPQIDLRAAADLMTRAGFALPVVDGAPLDVRYRNLGQLVTDLRAVAWTNMLVARDRRPLDRMGYAAAHAAFATMADADGRTTERFAFVHLSGWAPSADQPKPARRGSGQVSLASVLGKKD